MGGLFLDALHTGTKYFRLLQGEKRDMQKLCSAHEAALSD